ncbi:MAG: ABC transporter ATP-binding protein, partial [Spirochaetes bacterium]
KELVTMPGNPPDLVNPPKGCRFAPRCTRALDVCKEKTPELIRYKSREIACWLYKKGIVRNGKLN